MENIIKLKEIILDYINSLGHIADDCNIIDNLTSYTVYCWKNEDFIHLTKILRKDEIIIYYHRIMHTYKNAYPKT